MSIYLVNIAVWIEVHALVYAVMYRKMTRPTQHLEVGHAECVHWIVYIVRSQRLAMMNDLSRRAAPLT